MREPLRNCSRYEHRFFITWYTDLSGFVAKIHDRGFKNEGVKLGYRAYPPVENTGILTNTPSKLIGNGER